MLWQMISCFIKHNCVHRSTKRNNRKNSKNISFGNSHTVILKMWRRVNIKNEKFNNNGDNNYEIKSKKKTYKMKDLIALSVKGQVHAMAWSGDTLALFFLCKSRKFSLIWLKLFSACTMILEIRNKGMF